MKIKYILYTLLIFIFYTINLKADTIIFDSKNIQIEEEGNLIYSAEGIAKIPDQKIII